MQHLTLTPELTLLACLLAVCACAQGKALSVGGNQGIGLGSVVSV